MRYIKIFFFFLFALAVYFSFGFNHIGKFITADEHLWIYGRVPQYWNAISSQNWIGTYIHEKPGITLSIISGAGLLKYSNPTGYLEDNRAKKTGVTEPLENMLIAFRAPILIFNGLFSLFFFWILKKITKNKWISLWSAILILLSPILLGISQIVNADSLVWTFATATIFSFIAYLEKNEKKFAILTSLFLGFSMLTKFSATILLPFLFVISIIYYLEKVGEYSEKKDVLARKIFISSAAYFLIIAGSIAVFSIFLPASFFELKRYLYDGTIGYSNMPFILLPICIIQLFFIVEYFWLKNKITIFFLEHLKKIWLRYSKIVYISLIFIFLILIANYFFGKDFLNLESIPFDSRQDPIFKKAPLIYKIFLEFRPTVFSLTTIVLFSCLFLWIKSTFSNTKERLIAIIFSVFIVIYNAAIIQQSLLDIVRYNTIIYPAFAVMAAVGINCAIPENKKKPVVYMLITIIILLFSFISLWKTRLFYLNYSNFFLPKKYIISDSWGQGGYEAAEYLNSLPNSEKKTIWSDYYGVCEFFKGNCLTDYLTEQPAYPVDYFVLTRRGKIRYYQRLEDKYYAKKNKNLFQLQPYYEKQPSLWEMNLGKRPENYIKIISR